MNNKKTAIYAFSGDPVTYGHINIIQRALYLFDSIIVGIGVNPSKKYTFSIDERKRLAEKALSKFGNRVTVESFSGLLVHFAYERKINFIVRGIRNSSDYEYEKIIKDVNSSQELGIETIFICADLNLGYVSSSAVKEIQKNQGDVIKYVPLHVKQAIEEKISNQKIVGITGEIGAGKTHIANVLCQNFPLYTHNVELDQIARDILTKESKPIYLDIREELVEAFSKDILIDPKDQNIFIDTKKIRQLIFHDPCKLLLYDEIMSPTILFKLRQELIGKEGIILINSALLADKELLNICNNNVVMITASLEVRKERLIKRGYSKKEVEEAISSQMNTEKKLSYIKNKITEKNHGNIIIFNNDGEDTKEICNLFYLIEEKFNVLN